jgi:T4 RnlA family RNA ligase
MKFFIPTYTQCRFITDRNPNKPDFLCSTHYVQGYRIDVFCYKLAWYEEFYNISEDIPNAKELRGLAFVFNENIKEGIEYSIEELSNNIFNRYIMLEKFFNINQHEETQLHILKDKKIKSINDKIDGSLITFIKLPNGNIVAKTKNDFTCTQVIGSYKIYSENKHINKLVNYCIENNIVSLFEYTSWDNKSVLQYKEPNLTLLRLRNNKTGDYLDYDFIPKELMYQIRISKFEPIVELSTLLESYKTLENKEGSVVTFEDDYKVKIKTQWYFVNHKLITELIYVENSLIELILNEKIDDVISNLRINYQFDETEEDLNTQKKTHDAIEFIEEVRNKVNKYILQKTLYIKSKVLEFVGDVNNKNDIKEFYLSNKNTEHLDLIMLVLNKCNNDYKNMNEVIYDILKQFILKQTFKLMNAKSFLNKIEL